jgi:hypothetical protein
MNEIENFYKANGLKDCKLKTTEDLFKIHGVNFKAVEGYNNLDDINRVIYEKFIVNIFNAYGLESRTSLIPKAIYYAEEIEYLVNIKGEDEDYSLVVGGLIKSIDRNGLKTNIHTWTEKGYKDVKVQEKGSKYYLRFEYEHNGKPEWLHVTNENTWY